MNDYEKLLYKSNRQKHQLKILQDKCHKYKEVLDKIKEYITTRTPSDIGICGNEPKKYYTLNEDEVDYILELLEEIE